jgi:RNase P subunit RPR2
MKATNQVCEHCDELYQGTAYRVTSEEDGVILLDMIVCHSCSIEARRLGLETREHVDIRHVAFN